MMDAEEADTWRLYMGQDTPEAQFSMDLQGCDLSFCRKSIEAWASSLSRSPTLAAAEQRMSRMKINLGGDYRDLKHLLATETRAALLAVERRHFETSFTSC